MFYYFFIPHIESYNFLNLFNYLTFRAGGALFTAFFILLFLGPRFIEKLRSVQKKGQPIRVDGPKSISILLWADLSSSVVWLIFSITILFGLIGALDDYKKLKNNSPDGFSGAFRLIVEFLICFIFVYMFNKIIN